MSSAKNRCTVAVNIVWSDTCVERRSRRMHALRDSALFMLVDWEDVLSMEERECASLLPFVFITEVLSV